MLIRKEAEVCPSFIKRYKEGYTLQNAEKTEIKGLNNCKQQGTSVMEELLKCLWQLLQVQVLCHFARWSTQKDLCSSFWNLLRVAFFSFLCEVVWTCLSLAVISLRAPWGKSPIQKHVLLVVSGAGSPSWEPNVVIYSRIIDFPSPLAFFGGGGCKSHFLWFSSWKSSCLLYRWTLKVVRKIILGVSACALLHFFTRCFSRLH